MRFLVASLNKLIEIVKLVGVVREVMMYVLQASLGVEIYENTLQ